MGRIYGDLSKIILEILNLKTKSYKKYVSMQNQIGQHLFPYMHYWYNMKFHPQLIYES